MTPSGKVYTTRHRSRQADKEARYDDIFSAVTSAVLDEGQFGGISRRLIEENSMPVRMRLFSQSSHESSDEESEPEGSQAPPQSSSGRPQRRAALVARNAFEAVETIEEATDDAFERMLSSHAAAYAAEAAKRKVYEENRRAAEDAMRRVRVLEKERRSRESAKEKFSCVLCPMFYERHLQLHKHVLEKHESTGCPSCRQSSRVLRQRHECFKCGQFAANVKTHLIEAHYAVSSRRGALMECSRCSKTFDHLEEVLAHEKAVHHVLHRAGIRKRSTPRLRGRPTGGGAAGQFHCRECGDAFDTRYVRDQHLTKHFQSVLESVWLTVGRMQEEKPEVYQMNQCPLCTAVMSSRKSFRTHIIHRHLIHDRHALDMLVGPGVKQEELLMVQEHIALEGRKTNADSVDLPPIPRVKKEEMEEEEAHQPQQSSSQK